MRKLKILLLAAFALALTAGLFAQYTTVDFESGGTGANWTWVVGENGTNPDLLFIDNPYWGGINTSFTVAHFTALDAGQDWALCYSDDIEPFIFDSTNTTVKIMVYKSVLSNVAIKFEGTGPAVEKVIANTVVNQWQELTFDFTSALGNTYNRFVLIPDFAPRNQDNQIYFDNIVLPEGNVTPPAEPTVAAPAPTENPVDVISIYSDSYTNLPGTDFNPNWGQQTIVTVNVPIAGNNTLRYQNLNYQGTQFTNQDVSAYEALHVDFWTENSTDLGIYLISPGAETEYVFTIVPGEWVSVDIPLSHFVPPVNLANVFQFKVEGNGSIWFDNLYFWKNPTAQGTDATLSDLKVDGSTISGFAPLTVAYTYGLLENTVVVPQITSVTTNDPNASYVITQAAAVPGIATVQVTAQDGITTKTYSVAYTIMYPNSVPPVPTYAQANVISLFSDAYADVVVDTWLTPWSQGTYEEVIVAGNPVKKYTNLTFAGIETVGPNLLDVSAMTHVHIDVWSPDANDFKIKLVDWGADGAWSGGDDTEHELIYPAPATGQWISYDIPLSAFTGLNITGNMAQYILSKGPAGTLYMDNFYFYTGLNIPANVTITASPTQISITWDPVPGASSYTVYSSSDPLGTFVPVTDGTYAGTSWTSTSTASPKFFYVKASND